MIVTLIPAAGRSSRMGDRDKLLETIKGEAILARTARIACEASLGPVLVTLPPNDEARHKVLRKHKHDVTLIEVPNADEGMSASLRAGAEAAIELILAYEEDDYEYSGMMVLLPDMPEIATDDLKTMNTAYQASGGACLRASDRQGIFGHPTVFPLHVLRDFEALAGDKGAAAMFEAERIKTVMLGDRVRLDLDTPEDWAAWRARTNTPF